MIRVPPKMVSKLLQVTGHQVQKKKITKNLSLWALIFFTCIHLVKLASSTQETSLDYTISSFINHIKNGDTHVIPS